MRPVVRFGIVRRRLYPAYARLSLRTAAKASVLVCASVPLRRTVLYTVCSYKGPVMAQPKPERISVEEILKLVEKLSPEEQAKLRVALLEDQEDIRDALQCLADPGRIWSLEEAERELGLAD
jgi:hypothetical protein